MRGTFYILTIITILLFCFIKPTNGLSQADSTNSENNIIVITLNNGNELRGILIDLNDENISVERGKNSITTINRDSIQSYRIINSKTIQNKEEFYDESLNYSLNCFLPTAYITSKNDLFANSHYNGTYNLRTGLSDHFELSAGGVFINYYYLNICYSTELFDFIHFSTSVFGSFLWTGPYSPGRFGVGAIPRISIGNKNRNITIGFIGGTYADLNNWAYGGYFGAQRRFKERWTIAGELTVINLDTYNYFYLGDVIFKFNRKYNVNWNFGVLGIKFPGLNALFPNDIPFIPIPYFGYSRLF